MAIAYYNRGYTYGIVGQWTLGIADLNKAIDLSGDPHLIADAEKLIYAYTLNQ